MVFAVTHSTQLPTNSDVTMVILPADCIDPPISSARDNVPNFMSMEVQSWLPASTGPKGDTNGSS